MLKKDFNLPIPDVKKAENKNKWLVEFSEKYKQQYNRKSFIYESIRTHNPYQISI